MSYTPLQPLLEKVGNIYQLVSLASRRALQLSGGMPGLSDLPIKTKVTTAALEEIRQGKINIKRTQ